MSLTRRHFLGGISAVGGAAALGACGLGGDGSSSSKESGSTGSEAPTTSSSNSRPRAGDATLVMVTLDGGNDALNTVVPVDDPVYSARRGSLALPGDELHTLSDGFALHPALAGLKALWDRERLAIVHGVGFDDLDRSHFHCRDVWQAGSESEHQTGWVGRWLDAAGHEPLDAIAVGRTTPLLVRGEHRTAAVVPPGPFALPGEARLRSRLELMSEAGADVTALGRSVAASNADLLSIVDQIGPILTGEGSGQDSADGDVTEGDRLGLDVVAALIEAELPTRVYAVQLSGFDTHAAQAATHDSLMSTLDSSLSSFFDRVGDRPVTVAVTSEFGRRVAPNASDGTDHGRGGTVLLAGNVRPGHHGDPPSLDKLVDGDLATTVDFRAVVGALLQGVLGMPAADVLHSPPRPLALV